MKLILRVVINALALGAADFLLEGIRAGSVTSLVLTALVFGVLNALVRPLLKLLSCPLLVLTLGLFTLILNAVAVGVVPHPVAQGAAGGRGVAEVGAVVELADLQAPAVGGVAALAVFYSASKSDAGVPVYRGLCDASAVEALDANRFVVANDEDNVLRVYDRARGGLPVLSFPFALALAGYLTEYSGMRWGMATSVAPRGPSLLFRVVLFVPADAAPATSQPWISTLTTCTTAAALALPTCTPA